MQVEVQIQWNIDRWGQRNINSSPHPVTEELLENTCQIADKTWQLWFQQWLICLQPDISPLQSYELSLLFTDDAEIQTLNASYRHQDRPTDVLAFATLDQPSPPTPLWTEIPVELGDIVISVETADLQAQAHNHTLVQELAWLATHGLLHLLGWDHPTPEQLQLMLTQQQKLLDLINLPLTPGQH